MDDNNKEHAQPPDSPEAPKPPYESPIKYEIRNVDALLGIVRTKGYKIVGPATPITETPNISLKELDIFALEPQELTEELAQDLEQKMQQYLGPRLRVSLDNKRDGYVEAYETMPPPSLRFYLLDDDGNDKNIAYETQEGVYSIPLNSASSAFELENTLDVAMMIYRIYKSEQFRAKGLTPPEATIIIDGGYTREDDLKDFFKKGLINKINKNEFNVINKINKNKSPIIRDEAAEKLYRELMEKISGEAAESVKKKFGITRNPELEGLRQSIVVEDKPDVSFEDIAGQDRAVKEARDLARILAHPELFDQYGIDAPRGILFYGPPGTGKTMIAKALANEANSGFVYVKSSDIVTKFMGESEKLVTGVFAIAREEAAEKGHAILYLDEVDSILPPRITEMNGGGGAVGEQNRMIATILQEIDGLTTEAGKITVVASTNIPDNVDPAFLSRMSSWIEVPLPDELGRAKIFENHFAQRAKKAGKDTFLDSSVDLDEVAKHAEGLSGRDIADLVQIVLRKKALNSLDNGYSAITRADIFQALADSSKTRGMQKEARQRTQRIGFRPKNDKEDE